MTFSIKFNLFQSLSIKFDLFLNFLIKIGQDIIDFIGTTDLDSMNSDWKSDYYTIKIQFLFNSAQGWFNRLSLQQLSLVYENKYKQPKLWKEPSCHKCYAALKLYPAKIKLFTTWAAYLARVKRKSDSLSKYFRISPSTSSSFTWKLKENYLYNTVQ